MPNNKSIWVSLYQVTTSPYPTPTAKTSPFKGTTTQLTCNQSNKVQISTKSTTPMEALLATMEVITLSDLHFITIVLKSHPITSRMGPLWKASIDLRIMTRITQWGPIIHLIMEKSTQTSWCQMCSYLTIINHITRIIRVSSILLMGQTGRTIFIIILTSLNSTLTLKWWTTLQWWTTLNNNNTKLTTIQTVWEIRTILLCSNPHFTATTLCKTIS